MRVQESGPNGEERPPRQGGERWLDLVFRQMPGAAWATDRELRLRWVLGRIPGVEDSAADFVGQTVCDYVGTTNDADPAVAAHREALEGRSARFRYELRDRCYEVLIEPLEAGQAGVIGTVGAAVDVTERQRAERQLEESLSLLTATLNATGDGILVIDREGHVTAVNERFLELWRLPRRLVEEGTNDRLIAAVLDQLLEPEAFQRRVRELYASPAEESLDELHFRDGRVFERYSQPQRVGDEIVGRVWSFRDITERASLLARLTFLSDASRLLATLDAEQALRSIASLMLGSVADACAVDLFEQEGPRRLLTMCRAEEPPELAMACAAAPARPQLYEGSGRSWMSVPVLSQQRLLAALRVVAPEGRPYRQNDLESFIELGSRVALALENARAHQDACEALKARDEVLAIAAHEIRGPLTSMRLSIQTLRRKPVANAERAVFDLLDRETRRLARFVDELLDAVRVRGGLLSLRLEEVDLAEVIHEAVAHMADEVKRSGSKLSVIVNEPVVGVWDRDRLEQAIANLLSNALKYGLGRPITITLEKTDDEARLSVIDEGMGIAAERQAGLFQPFERGVSSRHYGGLGLGLYMVRAIAESMSGHVELESELGRGSTFRFCLPLTRGGRR